jgi:hypothetical protein
MSTQRLALSAADAVSEEDYQNFVAALSASARGRALLDEHARRHRQANTVALLDAIVRLEAQLARRGRAECAGGEHPHHELANRRRAAHRSGHQARRDGGKSAAALLHGGRVPPGRPTSAREAKPVEAPFALALTTVAAQAIAAAQEEVRVKIIKAGTIPACRLLRGRISPEPRSLQMRARLRRSSTGCPARATTC